MENLNEQMINEQPTFDEQQPPEQPIFDGQKSMMPPPPPMLGQFMPPPDANMWGNGEFAGEEIFNGENFGAPTDLAEISGLSGTDISVNFGQENPFGGFAQGEMMLSGFNAQGGQFAQPEQAQVQQAE